MLKDQDQSRFGGAVDLVDRKRWLNHRWCLFEGHRRHITEVLCALVDAPGQELAVLGAGSCVDIDLSRVAPAYEAISLIDLDGEALDYAPLLQPTVDFRTIYSHGGVDISGLYEIFEQWESCLPDGKAVGNAIAVAACHRLPELGGDFSVVLSDCVLSQLIEQAVLALGESHQELLTMITTLRRRHLEMMLDLTAPGGCVVMATDVVSSITAPVLLTAPEEQLTHVMEELIRAGNFFTGCNPYAIKAEFERNPHLRRHISTITLLHPWLWHLRTDRAQLVVCLIIRRRPSRRSTSNRERVDV